MLQSCMYFWCNCCFSRYFWSKYHVEISVWNQRLFHPIVLSTKFEENGCGVSCGGIKECALLILKLDNLFLDYNTKNTKYYLNQEKMYIHSNTYLVTCGKKIPDSWNSTAIHSGLKCLSSGPVYEVKYLCSRGWEWGRGATPTSISIFDFYDMKTLWFEFGNNNFTGFKLIL